MDPPRERQEDEFLQDVRLVQGRGVGADGDDVQEGGRVEVAVAEFGPPGEGGPDGEGGRCGCVVEGGEVGSLVGDGGGGDVGDGGRDVEDCCLEKTKGAHGGCG